MDIKLIIKKVLPKKILNLLWLYKNNPFPMNWTDEEREKGLSDLYFRKTGKKIDFENLNTFTQKLQFYKLYYHNENLKNCVCKYNFKKYIHDKLGDGYTIPLIGAWTNIDDIPWDKLPNTFVLKSNCSSDGNCIMFIKDKSSVDYNEVKLELRKWIIPQNTLINSFCSAYWKVTPMILAEEYVENVSNQLYDYKIFCFNGAPKLMYVATERFTNHNGSFNMTFYDLQWRKMDIQYGNHATADVPRPPHLEKMIEIAEKLCKDFPFVRVDFFDTDEKLYCAELTFYPAGGFNIYSSTLEESWGELFVLPKKEKIGKLYRNDLIYIN